MHVFYDKNGHIDEVGAYSQSTTNDHCNVCTVSQDKLPEFLQHLSPELLTFLSRRRRAELIAREVANIREFIAEKRLDTTNIMMMSVRPEDQGDYFDEVWKQVDPI